MPFVNIRINEGHSRERKDEIARRVVEAINDVTQIPKDSVWVVFERDDWYVGPTRVSQMQKK
jgi:4-oxalocrotonate tautomerase